MLLTYEHRHLSAIIDHQETATHLEPLCVSIAGALALLLTRLYASKTKQLAQ